MLPLPQKVMRNLQPTQGSNFYVMNSSERFRGGCEGVNQTCGIDRKTTATNALCGRTFPSANNTQDSGQSGGKSREWNTGKLRIREKVERDVPSVSFLNKMTVGLLKLYTRCNGDFKFKHEIPQRVLTHPSEIVSKNGKDNEDANLVLSVSDVLTSQTTSYSVLDLLGQGTFGQVFRCQDGATKNTLAIKVIKSKPSYRKQAEIEVEIVLLLNREFDANDEKNIVRFIESFSVDDHLCLVFELLSSDLYEVLKVNQFRGFPLVMVRHILKQIIDALLLLKEASIIHCDLKPENILVVAGDNPFVLTSGLQVRVKLIDFGSSCFEGQTMYSYIQSRFYRSPEVLLGLPYDAAIDMWSLGCISLELFLGLPVFPGIGDHDQISRIIEMLGHLPEVMLNKGKLTPRFFNRSSQAVMPHRGSSLTWWKLKTPEQFARDAETKVVSSKTYFRFKNMPDIVRHYPMPYYKHRSREKHVVELENRRIFTHFVMRMLTLDPHERLTPQQAANHPFITGRLFPQQLPSSVGKGTSAVYGPPPGIDKEREGGILTDLSTTARKRYPPKPPTSQADPAAWPHKQPHNNRQPVQQAYPNPVERNNVARCPLNRRHTQWQSLSGSIGTGLGSPSHKHPQHQTSPLPFSLKQLPQHMLQQQQQQQQHTFPVVAETGAIPPQFQDASPGQNMSQNRQLGFKPVLYCSDPIDVPTPTNVECKNHYQTSDSLNNSPTLTRSDSEYNDYNSRIGQHTLSCSASGLTRNVTDSSVFSRVGDYQSPCPVGAYSYTRGYCRENPSKAGGLQGRGPVHFPDFACMMRRPGVRNEQLDPLPHYCQTYQHSMENPVQCLNKKGKMAPVGSCMVAPNEQGSALWSPLGGSVSLVYGDEAANRVHEPCSSSMMETASDALLDHNSPSFMRNAGRIRSESLNVTPRVKEAGFMGRQVGGYYKNDHVDSKMGSDSEFNTIHFNESPKNVIQTPLTALPPPLLSAQDHSQPTGSLLAQQLHQYDVTRDQH